MATIKQPIITTEKLVDETTSVLNTQCTITNPYNSGMLFYRIGAEVYVDGVFSHIEYGGWFSTVSSNVKFLMTHDVEYIEAYIDFTYFGTAYTVKQLTESDKTISYKLVSVIKRDSNPDIYLKAFVNAKPSDTKYNVCIWEKTYNGVDWEEVPEFIGDGSGLIHLEVTDDSQISTELEGSSIKKKTKKFRKFNPTSESESLENRPDCLKLDKVDTATYRFSLYTLDNFIEELAFKEVMFQSSGLEWQNLNSDSTVTTVVYTEDITKEIIAAVINFVFM